MTLAPDELRLACACRRVAGTPDYIFNKKTLRRLKAPEGEWDFPHGRTRGGRPALEAPTAAPIYHSVQ